MRQTVSFAVMLALVLVGAALTAPASAVDGKAIFLAQKCETCHAVSTAGIEATTKSDKMKGPDLVGTVQAHDRTWVTEYIKKAVDKDGKKHVKEFKGTDEELNAVVDFLEAQKKG
jgi:cytochrome c2